MNTELGIVITSYSIHYTKLYEGPPVQDAGVGVGGGIQARFLKRQLSLPVSTMSQ